ncbi:hypothetical protein [Bradyrhizobium sp.]|jgi:hypothetical protein|uniref:hypothetical protein n=1 Tax=Bradyrhizobium sp. TaxID=376 RepID=UPI002E09C6BE|nr:hypothetical protein [Bradyrhizobium sp.]
MEPFDPASFTTAQLLWPAVLAALGAFLVAIVAAYVSGDFGKAFMLYLGVGLPIALVGYATGFLTGISRNSGAIGSLLPAVLALIGGLSVYAFGSDNKYRFVIGYCVCLLIVSLFYGTQRGAFDREFFREARLKSLFEMERRLQNYRSYRKLPEKSADWLLLGESAGK